MAELRVEDMWDLRDKDDEWRIPKSTYYDESCEYFSKSLVDEHTGFSSYYYYYYYCCFYYSTTNYFTT